MGYLKLLLAALLMQGAAPQTSQQPPQPPRTASIEGSVVGASGETLSKVAVRLIAASDSNRSNPLPPDATNLPPQLLLNILEASNSGGVSKTGTTDLDGKFIFENLAAGAYRVEVSKAGYLTTKYGQKGINGTGIPIAVATSQKVKNIQIAMTPAGAISGRIVDRNGEPISHATVQALKYSYQAQGRTLGLVQSVTTNDLGEYRLFWLPPGSYVVCAIPPQPEIPPDTKLSELMNNPALGTVRLIMANGSMITTGSGTSVNSRTLPDGTVSEESVVPVYFPGTSVVQQAAAVTVRAGTTESGINITAVPARVYKIRGRTVDGSGIPQAMTMVLSPLKDQNLSAVDGSLKSSTNGTFEITGVIPGSYLLAATMQQPAMGMGVVPLEVGNSDVDNVTVTTSSGFPLKGQIISEGPPRPDIQPNAIRLIRLFSRSLSTPSATAVIEPDGRFAFQAPAGVFPGDYQVSIPDRPGGGFGNIKSVRMGGQEGLTDGLHIGSQPEGELTVVVSSEVGKLEGRVFNERHEPAANATVVIVPEPSMRHLANLFFTPTTDAAGKFKIDAMPGRYKVFAWEDVEPGAWFDAEFMQNYESRGRPVTITDGATEAVEVTMIPYMP